MVCDGQALAPPALTLQQLNDDCLLHIFRKLDVAAQCALLQVHPHFEHVILPLWQREYAELIDFEQEAQCKLLRPAQLLHFLRTVASCSKALLHLDARICRTLGALQQNGLQCERTEQVSMKTVACKSVATPREALVSLVRWPVMFANLRRLQLSQTPICPNALKTLRHLTDLQLLNCGARSAGSCQLGEVFQHLRLEYFACVQQQQQQWTALQLEGIRNCRTLVTLQLGTAELAAVVHEAVKLPQLRQLTVVTTAAVWPQRQHQHIVSTLGAERGSQIVAVRLKCHFDRHFLRQLLPQLPKLHTLHWHSHLHVDYGSAADGIKWQAFDAQVMRALLQFTTQSRSLQLLDLRWNCHVQQTFVRQVQEALQHRPGVAVQWTPHFVAPTTNSAACHKKGLPELWGYYEVEISQDIT